LRAGRERAIEAVVREVLGKKSQGSERARPRSRSRSR
jgi:hypothetical protein